MLVAALDTVKSLIKQMVWPLESVRNTMYVYAPSGSSPNLIWLSKFFSDQLETLGAASALCTV